MTEATGVHFFATTSFESIVYFIFFIYLLFPIIEQDVFIKLFFATKLLNGWDGIKLKKMCNEKSMYKFSFIFLSLLLLRYKISFHKPLLLFLIIVINNKSPVKIKTYIND